jgi:hypothetical protein
MASADKQFQDSVAFRKFRWQLFHSSLTHILLSLKPFMTKPRVTRCGNGHFQHVIYRLGPYIAYYPEQALLACVESGWCPKYVYRVVLLTSLILVTDAQHLQLILTMMQRLYHGHINIDALQDVCKGDLQSLWDGYGVVGDIIVLQFPLCRCCNHLTIMCKQPFTIHFPRADIHELLTPDLLHQIIKGTFKDHLVTWIIDYITATHGKAQANEILADID